MTSHGFTLAGHKELISKMEWLYKVTKPVSGILALGQVSWVVHHTSSPIDHHKPLLGSRFFGTLAGSVGDGSSITFKEMSSNQKRRDVRI